MRTINYINLLPSVSTEESSLHMMIVSDDSLLVAQAYQCEAEEEAEEEAMAELFTLSQKWMRSCTY